MKMKNIGIYDKLRQSLTNFHISNCSIRSKNCIYIMFEDHQEYDENADVLFRAGTFYPKTKGVWGYDGFKKVYRVKSCVIPNGPAIVVDFNGQALSQTGEEKEETVFEFEKRLPLIRQIRVMQVREIDGKAYMAGSLRTVFRREGPNKWTCLSGNDLSVRDEGDRQKRDLGFDDIDGFSANDIYACGGEGDLFHYDGKQWHEIDSPTNVDLLSICCAGNGKVYVGGMKGMLLEGRGDEWEVVGKCGSSWLKSMAWYKDKLYIAADTGPYEYHNGKIQSVPGLSGLSIVPDKESQDEESNKRVKKLLAEAGADEEAVELAMNYAPTNNGIRAPAALHTVCTDGELLILGGAEKVAVFDGTTWKILYATYGTDIGGAL